MGLWLSKDLQIGGQQDLRAGPEGGLEAKIMQLLPLFVLLEQLLDFEDVLGTEERKREQNKGNS